MKQRKGKFMKIKVRCKGYKRSERYFTIGKVYVWEDGHLKSDNNFDYDVFMCGGADPKNWMLSNFYDFEVVQDQKIVITTDGAEVHATLYEDKKPIKTAKAKCSPDDTFSFATGAKLAFERLMAEEKFTPHLVDRKHHHGNIGEPTNYKDAIGRPLYVGDVVEHFSGDCKSYGDTVIVKTKLSYRGNEEKVFVMGIEAACDDKKGTTGDWKILKKRSFEEVANGERVGFIKYVKEI